jgi:hypothetical protein
MSKCQKNKYFIGSSCGTQGSAQKTDKAFQQDFAKLMAARDAQDSQIQETPQVTKAIVPFKGTVAPAKGDRASDIDTVLKGDY